MSYSCFVSVSLKLAPPSSRTCVPYLRPTCCLPSSIIITFVLSFSKPKQVFGTKENISTSWSICIACDMFMTGQPARFFGSVSRDIVRILNSWIQVSVLPISQWPAFSYSNKNCQNRLVRALVRFLTFFQPPLPGRQLQLIGLTE